jgi:hypothetical protein
MIRTMGDRNISEPVPLANAQQATDPHSIATTKKVIKPR